jgi:hypothetical protein
MLGNWKQYFNNLLNFETKQAKSNTEVPLQDHDEEEIQIPTYKEINNMISKLKRNKAPVPDCITSKLIQSGGYTLKLRIYNLILKIWNNEQVPEEWKERICPTFKKDYRRPCNNYRPITLLNVVYKIFAILLYNRIRRIVEHKIGDYQMGFRLNRSTIDNIFIICQIYEKCHEYNIELHDVFVDSMQAYDSVNRSMIPECLKQYKVPRKLINLFQDTLQHTKLKVNINNDDTAI